MADVAHSIPTSEIHELAGSSPPGTGRPVFRPTPPPRPRPQAKPRLGTSPERDAADRLAAQHGPNAEMIDLAGRIEALSLRDRALWERCSDLDGAVMRALPPRPVRAERQHCLGYAEAMVDGVKTTTLTEPQGWRDEVVAIEAAHAAAVAEHNRMEAEIGARLGLPLADKLARRASRRLSRWVRRLADLAPRTYADLRAKASALRAIDEDGGLYETERQFLAVSIGADAIRLIEAEAEERFLEDQARDGELFSLIARHGPAMVEWDDLDKAWDAEKKALRDSTGLAAIGDLIEAQSDVVADIQDAILDYLPRTFEGLQAKARWIAAGFIPEQRAEHLLRIQRRSRCDERVKQDETRRCAVP